MDNSTINTVVFALREDVNKSLEDIMYDGEISNFGVYDVIEDNINAYIQEILTNEKLRKKIVNSVSKTILQKHKERKKQIKAEIARDKKLWKATKGKIPCLLECGYHNVKTENEVLEGSNNFVCADCSKKMVNNSALFKIFNEKNIYGMFSIE
jgi:hypothetical protein